MFKEQQLYQFQLQLFDLLKNRFRTYWFPQHPQKGSWYIMIRINQRIAPVLLQAAALCKLNFTHLQLALPPVLTLWIDPFEVYFRLGETGRLTILYQYENEFSKPWQP